MRVPGFRPNYHNTAANRDVNWSTHNNPVNNCSVLFQLSSLELQIKNMTGGRLLRGATVPRSGLTDIRPATTRNLVELPDIKAITGSNAIRLAAHRFMDPNFKTPEALNIDPMIFSAFLLHPRATLELATPPPGPNERGLRRVSQLGESHPPLPLLTGLSRKQRERLQDAGMDGMGSNIAGWNFLAGKAVFRMDPIFGQGRADRPLSEDTEMDALGSTLRHMTSWDSFAGQLMSKLTSTFALGIPPQSGRAHFRQLLASQQRPIEKRPFPRLPNADTKPPEDGDDS